MAGKTEMETGEIPVDRLCRELFDTPSAAQQPRADRVLTTVLDELFPEQQFGFDEDVVKHSLDELLLTLIALREEGTHGRGLMDDLAQSFDTSLSPGTVYPRLNQMDEDGLLEKHELIQTKEYRIDDEEQVREQVADRMRQHLVIGAFLGAALEEFPGA